MRGNSMNWFLFALSCLFPLISFSGTNLSNLALFNRCYAQITGLRPSPEDPLTKQVISGQQTPIAACTQVLNKGLLTANGNTTIANTSDAEALAVLRNMHNLHASWFSSEDFSHLNADSPWWTAGVMDLWDNSTPALYFTKALFDSAPAYSATLSGNAIYAPVRATMNPPLGARSNNPLSSFALTTPFEFAPRGSLYGVRSVTSQTATILASGFLATMPAV